MNPIYLFFAAVELVLLIFIIGLYRVEARSSNYKPSFFLSLIATFSGFVAFFVVDDLATAFGYVVIGSFMTRSIIFMIVGAITGIIYRLYKVSATQR